MNFFDYITPANILAYWDSAKADQSTYMGEMLFPAAKIQGLELSKVGGRAGLPVRLKASAFDTQATYRDRLSIEVTKQKMPFFRERMKVDEETRQQILAISNDQILRGYVTRIFDDAGNLLRGSRATRERMAMELISTGRVKIEGNGVKLDYNYNLSNKQKVKASVAWTDVTNSKPIQDLIDWVDYFRTEFHVPMGFVVMNTKTFNLIKKSASTIAILYPTATTIGSQLVTTPQVKDLILSATGLRVLINDAAYADEVGGAGKPFYPEGVCTLLPVGGKLGNMVFGTTPEEIDLLTDAKTSGNTRITDTGVAVYTRLIDHPVNREVIVSQICLPSFGADVDGGAGSILIAKID
jgi:phage major capsid protein E|nr:MAG TPA: Major capsid protein [Inoviridae sp.]